MPADSRAAGANPFLNVQNLTQDKLNTVCRLNEIAHARSVTMAQLALAWVLENPAITSVITGASKLEQIRKTCRPFSALCRWQKKSVRLSCYFEERSNGVASSAKGIHKYSRLPFADHFAGKNILSAIAISLSACTLARMRCASCPVAKMGQKSFTGAELLVSTGSRDSVAPS